MNKIINNTNIVVNTPIATHCLRSKTNESNITCVTYINMSRHDFFKSSGNKNLGNEYKQNLILYLALLQIHCTLRFFTCITNLEFVLSIYFF